MAAPVSELLSSLPSKLGFQRRNMLKVNCRSELGGSMACGEWGRSRLLNLDAGMAIAS